MMVSICKPMCPVAVILDRVLLFEVWVGDQVIGGTPDEVVDLCLGAMFYKVFVSLSTRIILILGECSHYEK